MGNQILLEFHSWLADVIPSFLRILRASDSAIDRFIPNTAVFGPTNFIGTTTTITARMKILDEDF